MYPHQHLAVSLAGGAVVNLAATRGIDVTFMAGVALGSELVDLVDHPIYQLATWRTSALRAALADARTGGVREGLRTLRRLEDSRSINGLYLHNAYGLFAVVCLALVVVFTSHSVFFAALVTAMVGHMYCDILWDFRYVQHARNWFARRGMPWLSRRSASGADLTVGPLARFAVSLGLVWISIGCAVFWLLVVRCWQILAGARPVGAAPLVCLLLAVVVAGYLTAIAFLTYAQSRWISAQTGRSCPWAKRSSVPRGFPGNLLEQCRPQQGNVVLVGALLGLGLVPGLLEATFEVWPWLVEDNGRPGLFAVGVPLVALAVTLRHTTAAGLGTLTGVLVANVVNVVLTSAGQPGWNVVTSLTIFVSGLVAWVGGLTFSGLSGRVGGSAVVILVETPSTLHQLQAAVELGYSDLADARALFALKASRTSVVHERGTVRATLAGSPEHLSVLDPLGLRTSSSYSPLRHESAAVLGSTFLERGQVTPLLPRTQSRDTGQVDGWPDHLSWKGPNHGPGLASARPHVELVKPVGEIVDNLLTRRAELRTQLLWESEAAVYLTVYENTSTKRYSTPESEHLALLMKGHLVAAGVAPSMVIRVVGASSVQDLWPLTSEVTGGRMRRLPDSILKELQPASLRSIYVEVLVSVTAVVTAAQIASELIVHF